MLVVLVSGVSGDSVSRAHVNSAGVSWCLVSMMLMSVVSNTESYCQVLVVLMLDVSSAGVRGVV